MREWLASWCEDLDEPDRSIMEDEPGMWAGDGLRCRFDEFCNSQAGQIPILEARQTKRIKPRAYRRNCSIHMSTVRVEKLKVDGNRNVDERIIHQTAFAWKDLREELLQ